MGSPRQSPRRSPRLLLLPTMAMEATTAMATMASALLRLSRLLNTTSPFMDTTGTMASAPLMLSPRQSPRRSPRLLLLPTMAMEATPAPQYYAPVYGYYGYYGKRSADAEPAPQYLY